MIAIGDLVTLDTACQIFHVKHIGTIGEVLDIHGTKVIVSFNGTMIMTESQYLTIVYTK